MNGIDKKEVLKDVGFIAWLREKGLTGPLRAYQVFVENSPSSSDPSDASQVKSVFDALVRRKKLSPESAKSYRGRLGRAVRWYAEKRDQQESASGVRQMIPTPPPIAEMTLEDAADTIQLVKDLPRESHLRKSFLKLALDVVHREL